MKYKHHTLLPAGSFQSRGSVVGGRSLRLHGGDSMSGSYDPEYNDLMQRQHAEWLASRGYPQLLEEYNAQKAYEAQALIDQAAAAQREAERVAGNAYLAEQARLEAERLNQEAARVAAANAQREAEYQARLQAERVAEQQRQQAAQAEQQRIASIVAAYKPFDVNKYGQAGDEARQYQYVADLANRAIQNGRPDIAQQFIEQANALASQFDAASAKENEIAARNAQLMSNYKPFDLNLLGSGSEEAMGYYMAANRANELMRAGRTDIAQQFIDEANRYVIDRERAEAERQKLQQTYGTIPYGTGMGPALGYAYGMKNAEGDIFRKFDAQGNLTEFMDQHGQWQPASIFKPVGYELDEDTGQYRTTYLTPAGVERSNFEPNRYRDPQGGWLGEGGWMNVAKLVAAGLSAGTAAYLNAAGAAASGVGGLTSLGSSTAEALSAMQAFEAGLATTGTLAGAEAALSQYLTDAGSQFAGVIGDVGESMLFDDLVTAVGLSPEAATSAIDTAVDIGTKISDIATKGYEYATQPKQTPDQTPSPVAPPPAPVIDTTPPPPPAPTYVPPTYTPSPVTPATVAPVIPQLQNTPAPNIINTIAEQATKNQESGMTREEAVNAAITGISSSLGVTEQNILDAIGVSKGDLTSQIANLGTGFGQQLSGVETRLQDQIAKNEAAGMSRDQALDAAIRSVSTQMGMTERNLLDSIQGTKTELGKEIQSVRTELAGVESNLLNQIYQYELAGLTRDQALQKAITGVSTQLGLTEQNLLNELGVTKNELSNKITDVETNLGGQITDVGGKVTDLTQDFTEFSDWTREQEENRRRKQEGEEAVNLLSQMASGSVKSGIPAKIDYMYDISGDSIFATPKQESLMPSPFEEAPEPVEGAMPRYQYYDPSGGYLYAGGGMVAFEEGGLASLDKPEKKGALARMAESDAKVFEALAAYGSDPQKYEDIYSFYTNPDRPRINAEGKELPSGLSEMSKDYSGLDMAVLGLIHSAKQSGNPERFLESLAPYYDKKAKFDFTDRVGPKNYVMPIVAPNTANIGGQGRRGEHDVRSNPTSNLFFHEMEHTLQNCLKCTD